MIKVNMSKIWRMALTFAVFTIAAAVLQYAFDITGVTRTIVSMEGRVYGDWFITYWNWYTGTWYMPIIGGSVTLVMIAWLSAMISGLIDFE